MIGVALASAGLVSRELSGSAFWLRALAAAGAAALGATAVVLLFRIAPRRPKA